MATNDLSTMNVGRALNPAAWSRNGGPAPGRRAHPLTPVSALLMTCLPVLACLVVGPLGSPSAALAAPLDVRVELTNEIPVQVGIGVIVAHPESRIRGRGSVGFVPTAYVALANEVTQQFEPDYTDAAAGLVESTLERSLVVRSGVGWRPFERSGFTVGIGYSLITLGGGSTTQEVVEGVYGIEVDDRFLAAGERPLSTEATLHMADLMCDWDVELDERMVLRLSVGWSYTFANSTSVTAEFEATREAGEQVISQLEEESAAYLHETIRDYVHPLQIGISFGYRF